MWKWKKEFFYFSKGDRIAIILLLNLIVISGGIFIYMNQFTFVDSVYKEQDGEVQRGFVQFNNSLQEIEPIKEEILDTTNSIKRPLKPNKVNKQKLELGQTIDLNSTSAITLTRIPGIGSIFAERIIDYRNSLGGFVSLEQLYEIKGITIKKYSTILPYLILKNKYKTINVSKATKYELTNHPYFEDKHIQAIIELQNNNEIKDISSLSENKNFSSRDIDRLAPYLTFD